MHLFTYGSLMYPEVWSRVVNGAHSRCRATVAGFSRHQLPGATHPAMIAGDPHSVVEGVLYSGLTLEEISRLDRFEDEGIDYKRITVKAETEGGAVEAFTYTYMHPARVSASLWDPVRFEEAGLQVFLDTYVRQRE